MDRIESPGGPEQFATFVQEFGERAFQFAYRLSGNVEEAKDAVQEAFYRVLRSWDDYDASRSLEAWFFTILRNIFIDGRKRSERRRGLSLDLPVVAENESAATYGELLPAREEMVLERLQRAEAAEEVRETLERLGYEQRVILSLCDMQGLSYEEIARVLEAPVGTVRSRISRARQAFRAELARGRGVENELS